MRAKEARMTSIWAFLKSQGFHPVNIKEKGKELRYHSPIRSSDSSPSFKVDTVKNLRYDFGLAKGGNALDLVCELKKLTIKQALAYLDGSTLYQSPYHQNEHQKNLSAGEKEKLGLWLSQNFEVIKVWPVNDQALLHFLAERNINHSIAKKYLSEIQFKPSGSTKNYKALAWACGDGFEARNKFFKGFVGSHKSIIELNLQNENSLSIFEGFMDFLAFLTFFGLHDFKSSVIILNSISLKNKALEKIKSYNFSRIYLFLDNDKAGIETKNFFMQNIKNIPVIDKSDLYKGYKDFNQMTIEGKK